MILVDTNVIIDALDSAARDHAWAFKQVVDAVSTEGGAINTVILAELCAGKRDPANVSRELRQFGLDVLDLPAATGPVCGKAYRSYKTARISSSGSPAPLMPLPDFFIGSHAEIMGWKVATRDKDRFAKYFPAVKLLTP